MQVLMLIISSDDNPVYAEHREVWMKYMNSNSYIDSYFIQNREGPQEVSGNTFWLHGEETLENIISKTLDSLDFFLNQKAYDYVVRTNLSSFWNFRVLLSFLQTLPKKQVYSGIKGFHDGRITFVSGAGIIMSQDVAKLLLDNRKMAESVKIMDDVDIGYTMEKLRIPITLGKRNDSLIYDKSSYHYRVKTADRRIEYFIMQRLYDDMENEIARDDIITSDKYIQAFPAIYYKTDCIAAKASIDWRGKTVFPPKKNQQVIISGHSDHCITDELVTYYSPRTWWTINKQTTDKRVRSLPLGITNDSNESPLHPIYGNLDCMIQVMNEPKRDKNLVYMNFDLNTHHERKSIYNLFKEKEWVTVGTIENTMIGRTNFLRDTRNHAFALCPRGNGVDTHRLWETLYMGSIPVVKRDIAYTDFSDLPICFVDSWNDITKEFLEAEKQSILSQEWNLKKLKIGYWLKQIRSSIN